MLNLLRKIFSPAKKSSRELVLIDPAPTMSVKLDQPDQSEIHKQQGDDFLDKGEWVAAARCYKQAISINPKHAAAYSNLGYAESEQGLYEEAEHSLQQAILNNPALANAYYLLGSVSQKQGKLDQAIGYYKKVLELKPDLESVYQDLCFMLFQQGQTEEARHVILKGISHHPGSATLHYYLGNVHSGEGALDQAIDCYQKALSIQPEFPEVYFNLGNALKEQGKKEEAVDCFLKALSFRPDQIEGQFALGNLLKEQARLDEALACYRRALSIKPDFVEALSNMGSILREQDKLDEARACFDKVLLLAPDLAVGHYNLGCVLKDQHKPEEALACYQKAVSLNPDFVEALNVMASTLREQGKLEQAIAGFRRVILIQPDLAEAHLGLGDALKEQGKLDEALASYRQALVFKPDVVVVHNNMGNLFREQGKLVEAQACYRKALSFEPEYAEAHNNSGIVFLDQGNVGEALNCFQRVLSFQPDFVAALINQGIAMQSLGRLYAAVASYRRALKIEPDHAEALSNLGNVLGDVGQLDDAVASFRRAFGLKPDYVDPYHNLLFTLNYHPDLSGEEIFAAYREFDQRFGLPCRSEWQPHGNSRDMARRLKVGYVSPDFRHHSCRFFLEPLLSRHDKNEVEVFAYAELTTEDAVTARYRKYVDRWVPTLGLTDVALAERIRADGIDILVDLAGHTNKGRLQVFARKPAPVSVSWLGYGYTTGLTAIDYYLTDAASVPVGGEGIFSEMPWRVPTPCYCYRPAPGMGPVNALPAAERGYITFGTLTRGIRINHKTVRVWSEILNRVQGSRLVIDSSNFCEAETQDALAKQFTAHGVERDRLEIGYHSPPWDVLRGIDIGLDCFPHNSGTTLFESLYMGVPIVSLAGRPGVGRLGSTILEGVGHPEWIAHAEEEYINIAVTMANDREQLAATRSGLRKQMEDGPLMDEAGFAQKVEAAYRAMFEKWAIEQA